MIEDVLCLFSFFEMMYFLTILSRRHVRDAVFHFQLKLKIGWGAKNYFWLKVKINLLCCFASFSRKKIRFYFSLHPSHKDEVNVVTFFCLFLLFSLHRSFVILLVIELRYFNMRQACCDALLLFLHFHFKLFCAKSKQNKMILAITLRSESVYLSLALLFLLKRWAFFR
jgi:hypothetical protein